MSYNVYTASFWKENQTVSRKRGGKQRKYGTGTEEERAALDRSARTAQWNCRAVSKKRDLR